MSLPKPDDFYVIKDTAYRYILMRTRPDTDRSQCVKQTNVIATTSTNNGKAFEDQVKVVLIPV